MSSDLLQKMLSNAGVSNAQNVEQARAELAGAITRVVINETIAEAKKRAKIRDETVAKQGEKSEQFVYIDIGLVVRRSQQAVKKSLAFQIEDAQSDSPEETGT